MSNTEVTEAADATTSVVRTETGQFPKGASGNPAGRPKNRKNKLIELQQDLEIAVREHLSVERVKRIVNRVAEMAEGGHIGAAKLIFDKIIANARDSDNDNNDGRTVVFRIENATFAAQQDKTQTPIEVIDVTPEDSK